MSFRSYTLVDYTGVSTQEQNSALQLDASIDLRRKKWILGNIDKSS